VILGFDVSDTLEALNAGLFVSPGFGTHPERVLDSYELMFVTQGRLDMFEENRSFPLLRNQTLLLCPGLRHGGLLPYAPDVNFYWVHFRVRHPGAGHRWVGVPKVASIINPDGMTELFCRFISDQESGILDKVSAAHLVALMLIEASTTEQREWGMRAAPRTRAHQRAPLAQEIQAYIDGNFRGPITTSSIARDFHRSADYLERVFRRHRDTSILEAVHIKRVTAARAMLRTEGRKNINEVAFACGYSDPGYFRRMFRRLTGLSPKKFRSLYTRTHINAH